MALAMLVAGCAGSKSPVEGDLNPDSGPGLSANSDLSSGTHRLWGYYWVIIDPDTYEFEVVPSREIVNHFNIRGFLEDGSPCSNCFKITSFIPGSEYASVDIEISHPWADANLLTGFDVRGIAMWNGDDFWPGHGLTTQDPHGPHGYIRNADGYSTNFNPTDYPPGSDVPIRTYTKGKFATPAIPDSTLNPYIDYYSDENRHLFASGESVTRTWQVVMPSGGPFVLGYAIDASWKVPDVSPPVNIPDDFSIEANKSEAYQITVTQPNGLGTDVGSATNLQVRVWDWQNNPKNAKIECPSLWTGLKNHSIVLDAGQFKIFTVPIENETGVLDGEYRALVSVEDPDNSGSNFDLTAYKFFNIQVGEAANQPPVSAAEATALTAYIFENIGFSSLATDPDGPGDIVDWWWDWENDGTWDDQASTTTHSYAEPGVYQIDHRVTDMGGLEDDLEPDDLLQVEIFDPCCENVPLASAEANITSITMGEQVTFTSFSFDPDGENCVSELSWDFENDGVYDAQGGFVQKIFPTAGLYEVQHRIIDKCGLEDTLDEPIIIEVVNNCCEEPPVAIIDPVPPDIVTNQVIVLSHSSFDPESPSCPVTVSWDLDDDGQYDDSEEDSVPISWDTPGFYNIGLRVEDDCGLITTTSTQVTVHIGIIYEDDANYKVWNTRYDYLSADIDSQTVLAWVDVADTDGPWDFTGLTLADEGHHRAILPTNHSEVADFDGEFAGSHEHIYKNQGMISLFSGPIYIAENYSPNPDSLDWVGFHDPDILGTVNLFPQFKNPFPFWVLSDNVGYVNSGPPPPLIDIYIDYIGWGEGDVTVPWNDTTEFSLVVQYEITFDSPFYAASVLIYEWLLDDGYAVALVSAINTDSETNYDSVTKEITGIATFNALSDVGPY
jgi:hypothetical protein